MATNNDGTVLPSVSEAGCICTPVAGEHGQEGAVAFMSCLWVSRGQLVGHCVNRILE